MDNNNIIPPPPTHIFLPGNSWGCAFYIGVYRALQEMYGLRTLSKCKWAGNSSGSYVALCAAAGHDWTLVEKWYLNLVNKARRHGVFGKMSLHQNTALDDMMGTNSSLYKKLNDRLFIGVTQFVAEYKIISRWSSNEEVRDCILASGFVPFYCTSMPKIKIDGEYRRTIDGMFSRGYHRFDDTTLVVTSFGKKGDISTDPAVMTWS
eukprot:79194_1